MPFHVSVGAGGAHCFKDTRPRRLFREAWVRFSSPWIQTRSYELRILDIVVLRVLVVGYGPRLPLMCVVYCLSWSVAEDTCGLEFLLALYVPSM